LWLTQHPEIEIISRDRAGAYAEGAKRGAPNAKQVADCWHLLKNLGEAIERALQNYSSTISQAAQIYSATHQVNVLCGSPHAVRA
jgi:transposase